MPIGIQRIVCIVGGRTDKTSQQLKVVGTTAVSFQVFKVSSRAASNVRDHALSSTPTVVRVGPAERVFRKGTIVSFKMVGLMGKIAVATIRTISVCRAILVMLA